jgi:hypothetical protein
MQPVLVSPREPKCSAGLLTGWNAGLPTRTVSGKHHPKVKLSFHKSAHGMRGGPQTKMSG